VTLVAGRIEGGEGHIIADTQVAGEEAVYTASKLLRLSPSVVLGFSGEHDQIIVAMHGTEWPHETKASLEYDEAWAYRNIVVPIRDSALEGVEKNLAVLVVTPNVTMAIEGSSIVLGQTMSIGSGASFWHGYATNRGKLRVKAWMERGVKACAQYTNTVGEQSEYMRVK
jgi:hypothetical protein